MSIGTPDVGKLLVNAIDSVNRQGVDINFIVHKRTLLHLFIKGSSCFFWKVLNFHTYKKAN